MADRLDKRWSPEQLSHALRGEFPDDPDRQVVPETIYQAVYRPELLRQYFPKGTDLRMHSADQLAAVAAELNDPKPPSGNATVPSG